jgi:hypothetical protein
MTSNLVICRSLVFAGMVILITMQFSGCTIGFSANPPTITSTPAHSPSKTPAATVLSASPTPKIPPSAGVLREIQSMPGKYFAIVRFTGRQTEYGYPETELALYNESGEIIGSLAKSLGPDARLSPDNRLIAYGVGLPDGPGKLLVTDLCTGKTVLLAGLGDNFGFSWNEDGTKLALAKKDGIYLVSYPSGKFQQVTKCNTLGEEASCEFPEISPNGKYIAYTGDISSPVPNPRTGIYVADTGCLSEGKACENTVSPILNPPSAYSWAPDSQSIVLADGINIKEYFIPSGKLKKDFPQDLSTQQNIKWLRWFTRPEALVAIDVRDSGILYNSTGLQHFKIVTEQSLLGLAGLIVIGDTKIPICGN